MTIEHVNTRILQDFRYFFITHFSLHYRYNVHTYNECDMCRRPI